MFNTSEMQCIKESVSNELKNWFEIKQPDDTDTTVEDEMINIIKKCDDKIKDDYGYLNALIIMEKSKHEVK